MEDSSLLAYVSDPEHHGLNKTVILEHFSLYLEKVKDPLNVIRFMEEKAICIFLPKFWLLKAEYLAEYGDYRTCFECLQQARSRDGLGDDQIEIIPQIELKEREYMAKMKKQMNNELIKGKRLVQQFYLNSQTESDKQNTAKNIQKMLKVYQTSYTSISVRKQRVFQQKRDRLPESWIFETYQDQQTNGKPIQNSIHENSIKLSREVRHHTMTTPIRLRDPQRLTRTMDSVEILRKRQSSHSKARQRINEQQDQGNDSSLMMNSMPVGKRFTQMKARKVTFDTSDRKTQQAKRNREWSSGKKKGSSILKKVLIKKNSLSESSRKISLKQSLKPDKK